MTVARSAMELRGKLLARCRAVPGAWIIALAMSLALLLLPEIIKLDGKPHADWQQFLGRFHPLAVHLPIGLIVLVPVLEIAGAFRPALREAAGFVLGLACVLSIATLMLGYLLAYGSGDTGATVARHMWGGIALAIGLMICLLVRPGWSSGSLPHVYPTLLGCVMVVLLWTSHQGGSLTHGTGYLTEYMPAPLKRFAAMETVNAAAPDSFYTKQIHPILDANCITCHGTRKAAGGLRLDSYEALMRGGKDGAVIVPRNSEKSLLIERITLPSGTPHAMPAEGRPSLKPSEIAWMRAWIGGGASPADKEVAGVNLPARAAEPPPDPVGDYSNLTGEVAQLRHAQGAKLLALSSKPSDGLILNTVDVASSFGDAQLAQLQKFAPYIVEANLARTSVTDASFDTLARFTHLHALHLEGTSISGHGLAKLAALQHLSYLNLSETKVTADALGPLKSMPNLRHIYLFNTPAEPAFAGEPTKETAGGAR